MRSLFARLKAAWRPQQHPSTKPSPTTLLLQLQVAGWGPSDWIERIRSASRLYGDPSDDTLALLRMRLPRTVKATLAAAAEIHLHRFNLLGSGPYVPVDADRPVLDGYLPIDWTLDPISGLRFPKGIPHTQWDLLKMRPGNADVKLPWELARCQHWPVLGQAWRLTGDHRHALEMLQQLEDFMEANPVGIGIHWTCTMDVALRALNWALGLALIRKCPEADNNTLAIAYSHLFDHGTFIYNNLENKYEVTSNHFLSNVVGLYYLAAVFHDLPEAAVWNTFCRDALEREMQVQVLDDGADYESSIPYHRLVTELFLGAARLADFRSQPLSDGYRTRLKSMVSFMAAVLRPDGLMPQVGDADDGRLHIFSSYGNWNPQDPRHLFGPAALTLNEPGWLKHAGPDGTWETAWWGFDITQVPFADNELPAHARLFPEAGIAVSRPKGQFLLISNGIVGTKGFGNHKHNDQLGFELHMDGNPLIVDPGSYVYTSDFDARNLFRGTGYHNTLAVDGEDQNELRPEWLFRLFENAHAEHLYFHADKNSTEYHGRHVGYDRLSKGKVLHERRFRLLHSQQMLVISDILDTDGTHDLAWHFHLAPGISAAIPQTGLCRFEAGGKHYALASLDGLAPNLSDAWYSPAYGVRQPCRAVDFVYKNTAAGRSQWGFAIAPEAGFDLRAVMAAHIELANRDLTVH
ncbi:MAG: alginate lyase family protein [Xanthomonadales bacterium]|nr:alginate lyase family protein [Xanthomonadales bacterium]